MKRTFLSLIMVGMMTSFAWAIPDAKTMYKHNQHESFAVSKVFEEFRDKLTPLLNKDRNMTYACISHRYLERTHVRKEVVMRLIDLGYGVRKSVFSDQDDTLCVEWYFYDNFPPRMFEDR